MEKVLQMEKVPGDGDEVGDTVSLSSSAAIHVSFAYRDCHSLSPCLPVCRDIQWQYREAVPGGGEQGIADWLSRCGIFALSFLRFCDNSRFINCLCVSFAITLQNTLAHAPPLPTPLQPLFPFPLSGSTLDLRRKQKC